VAAYLGASYASHPGFPLRWKKPRHAFVNSLSDLFSEDVPAAVIRRVFAVMP
jgi:protein gp37